MTTGNMYPVPPPSTYLGDSLYADFSQEYGVVRIWASTGTAESYPLYLSPDVIMQLLDYASRCYASSDFGGDENFGTSSYLEH